MNERVTKMISEPRRFGLPVTGSVLESSGLKTNEVLLKTPDLADEETGRLSDFVGLQIWRKKIVKRNSLASIVPPGEANNVDVEAISERMAKSRRRASGFHRKIFST